HAAIGEVGLDRAIEDRNDQEQEVVFLDSLALAREFRRPLSVHCRRAWAALIECLQRVGHHEPGLVIHSYSGSLELIEPLASFGARFSFSGSITYPANRRGRKAAAAVPLELLLVETDAPDIPPCLGDPGDGKEGGADRLNEPGNVALVIKTLSQIRGMKPEELAERVWENSQELFGLCE
ncbi:MAG: TatD family hydrolase, partial [Kiritimatiellia bacterium]